MLAPEKAGPNRSPSWEHPTEETTHHGAELSQSEQHTSSKSQTSCTSPLNRWIISTLRSETGNEEMKETLSDLIVADSPSSFFQSDTPRPTLTPVTVRCEDNPSIPPRLSLSKPQRSASSSKSKSCKSPLSARHEVNSSKASVYLMDQVKHLSSCLDQSEKNVSEVLDGKEKAEAHICVLERELKAAREALLLMGQEAKQALEDLYVLSVNKIEQTTTPKPMKQPASTLKKPSRPLPWESNNAGHRHRKALEEEILYFQRKAQLLERKLQKERAERVKQHVNHLNSLANIAEHSAPDREKVQAELDATVFRLRQENNRKLTNLEVLLQKSRSVLNEERAKNKTLQKEISTLKTKIKERSVREQEPVSRVSLNTRGTPARCRAHSEEVARSERTPRCAREQNKCRRQSEEFDGNKALSESLAVIKGEKQVLEKQLREVVTTMSRLEENCRDFKDTVISLRAETASLKLANSAHEAEIVRLKAEKGQTATEFNLELKALRENLKSIQEAQRENHASELAKSFPTTLPNRGTSSLPAAGDVGLSFDEGRARRSSESCIGKNAREKRSTNGKMYKGLLQLVEDHSKPTGPSKGTLSSDW